MDWVSIYLRSQVTHAPYLGLDHVVILLNTWPWECKGIRVFKFENFQHELNEYENMVWASQNCLVVDYFGSLPFYLHNYLIRLMEWSKNDVPNREGI